ncbi:MAG TPA: spore coat protein GerQ [Bacillus sp. (in: firmicutes)]|uniref:spore coat protein GerQ n=1 Tax=Bacillus litorisediminis TaxID=2922713 RepID=UPI001FAB3E68|nr:spore coat protein GerQ [Bacillus litorisediminis]HWO77007.1 spore coat protein GerQ [Bacillus sp. (in: firmicutes)]
MSTNNSYPYYPYGGNPYRQQASPYQGQGAAGYPQGGVPQGGYPQAGTQGLVVPGMPSAPYTGPQVPGMLPVEQSYIENIFRLNKGKLVTVYMSFENSTQWQSKIFKGVIEAAGRDHLILSDPQTGTRYLLPLLFLDYATFEEEIEYEYPFAAQGQGTQMATYSPR